jgi:hypothetical protein
MKIQLLFVPLLNFLCLTMTAQNNFVGTFIGTTNGDRVVLHLKNNSPTTLSGTMTDSQQTFTIAADINGNHLTGTAYEKTFNLTFQMAGTLKENQLTLTFVTVISGQTHTMSIDFQKQSSTATSSNVPSTTPQYKPPKGKIDPQLVGLWVNTQMYSSGYGSNAMSGTTSSSLAFNADGTMSDGGSSASISGSNYSGNTGTSASKTIEGVQWYAENNNIYLVLTENGKTETVLLGRYYIEGTSLLITAQNGEKKLLKKQ